MTHAEIVAEINSMINGVKYTTMFRSQKNVGKCCLIKAGSTFDWYINYTSGKDYVVVEGGVYGFK